MEKTIFEINETFIANLKLQCVETKLKHADISLVRTEMMTTEALDEIKNVLFEWEIFNGATVRGQTIPVRFFLDRLSLGPTLENMEDEYSVLYNLNLTVSDENDRSFFQLIPIKLFRRKPEHTTIN
uniref:Vacuolar protein sorting-associated protein 26A (Trinotate prediction) n=1 Tax=Myxobolus squamalis TaxID=59785 RepID=A0A6B2GBG9_MYXSQ